MGERKRTVEAHEQAARIHAPRANSAQRLVPAPGCFRRGAGAAARGISFSNSCVERRKIRRGRRAARMNHDVPSRGNLLSMQSHNFAQPAPDAIAPHRGAQRLLDAPAEPAEIEAIGAKKSVNSRLDRRRPSRYTASYSARRTRRHSRGKPSRGRIRRA